MARPNRDYNLRVLSEVNRLVPGYDYLTCGQILGRLAGLHPRERQQYQSLLLLSNTSLGKLLTSCITIQDEFIILRQRTRGNSWEWRLITRENATPEELELGTQLRRDLSPARQVPKPCIGNPNTAKNPLNRYERVLAGVAVLGPNPCIKCT